MNPLILIDENLADIVLAKALSLVDFNAKSVKESLGQGVEDATIINWVGLQRGVWVTTDKSAKFKYKHEIEKTGINIIWVRPPKDLHFSKKMQLLLLLWILDTILEPDFPKLVSCMQFTYQGCHL